MPTYDLLTQTLNICVLYMGNRHCVSLTNRT